MPGSDCQDHCVLGEGDSVRVPSSDRDTTAKIRQELY